MEDSKMDSEKKVLTPDEVSKILGVNRKSVYNELHACHIPHVKIGDRYIIGKESFFKWLEGTQPKAGSGSVD